MPLMRPAQVSFMFVRSFSIRRSVDFSTQPGIPAPHPGDKKFNWRPVLSVCFLSFGDFRSFTAIFWFERVGCLPAVKATISAILYLSGAYAVQILFAPSARLKSLAGASAGIIGSN